MHEETDFDAASFTSGSAAYERPTSIHHWQLRDLVSAADNEHEFYVPWRQQVVLYNSKLNSGTPALSLGFDPNSMTYAHGYLAAGGLHSELEVRHVRGGGATCFKGNVGGERGCVNNALHIGKHSDGSVRLFVCNNDSTVKVYALPSMTAVTVIRTGVPINYAALSPDGQSLVCAGDTPTVLVYSAHESGYTLTSSYTEAQDVGMCCAWSHYGNTFAAAHQDGTLAAWDRRSGRLVAKMCAETAARCVKFARGPVDLLAVSEHEDQVHLIDARRWRASDILLCQPPPPSEEGGEPPMDDPSDISGIAFTPSGRRLWVGMRDGCMSWDVDCSRRTRFSTEDIGPPRSPPR
ncbi:MAG: WD40-repeat-containing domain protein [Monoraphidium minutum]|nr:MAG: WD40-repeat-containing domain protein [Monoraphidium minutum]